MTSSDLEEIIGLGDTIVTMFRGRQVGLYARSDVTMARVVADITHPVEPGDVSPGELETVT